MYVTCIFVKRQGTAACDGTGRSWAIRGVPFLFLNMIGSPKARTERKAILLQPQAKSSQYLIDSYNTYLTYTDSDSSNGLWKMFLLLPLVHPR